MFRNALLLGLCTAVFSSIGAFAYAKMYNDTLFDYSTDLGYMTIISVCVFVSIAAGLVYWGAVKGLGSWGELIFNFGFCMGTMASIFLPMNAKIANEIPDFYPVYAIPLHFFPVLVWMSLRSLFFKTQH